MMTTYLVVNASMMGQYNRLPTFIGHQDLGRRMAREFRANFQKKYAAKSKKKSVKFK